MAVFWVAAPWQKFNDVFEVLAASISVDEGDSKYL
jgi:hypothetical protein